MNKININVNNYDEIKSEIFYDVRELNLNPELITPSLIKLYCSNFLFFNSGTKETFKTITNYIYVQKVEEEKKLNRYDIDSFTFIKETEDEFENTNWNCVNLVFETLLFLFDPDNKHEEFKKFLDKVQKMFNTDEIKIDDLDILFIYILYTQTTKLTNLKKVYDILTLLFDNEDFAIEIIFDLKKITNKEKFIDEISEKIYNKYLSFLSTSEKESKFLKNFDNNVIKYNEILTSKCFNKIKKLSFKEDTNIELKITFFSTYDIFEIFNSSIPNDFIPYLNIKDFNKILSNFKLPNEWVNELIDKREENNIHFYILNQEDQDIKNKIKPSDKNYSECLLKEVKRFEGSMALEEGSPLSEIFNNKTYFEFELSVQILNTKVKKSSDKDNLIVRIFNNLPLITNFKDIKIEEKVNKGIIMYNILSPLNFIPIPIVQHYFMLDDFSSFFIQLEQQYTIDRKRGGEPLYLFRNNELEPLVQNKNFLSLYNNFDCKLNLYYDKVGKQSTTKINFPNFFEKTDKAADVLIFKYTKNKLSSIHLKRILDVIVCYISNDDNIEEVKETYENLFQNF